MQLNNGFIWGFQRNFQIVLKNAASRLFKQIDSDFKPELFFIGVLADISQQETNQTICLEPLECGYKVESFKDLMNLALQLEIVDPEKKVSNSKNWTEDRRNLRIADNALRNAIKKILSQYDFFNEKEIFISFPNKIDKYKVFVILELESHIINRFYSLRKEKDDIVEISKSFLESTGNLFLEYCTTSLNNPDTPLRPSDNLTNQILRDAGSNFMYIIANAGKNVLGVHGLFEACNSIASLKYEGADGFGKMIIAEKNHPNIRYTIKLKEPIEIFDYRRVRKVLELSTEKLQIICDSELIYGLGEQTGVYNSMEESLFVIDFLSHFKWEALHDNKSLMVVEYRQPNLLRERIDKNNFDSTLGRVFKNIDLQKIGFLWEIANAATEQKHGTMLVISDAAADESTRLAKQSFPINPVKLTAESIKQLTSIDGAVLLDTDGICHSIGVILDGLATESGDSSRGARFNSALRYSAYKSENISTVIIIISEDGMIDLVPKLLPQIKRSDLLSAIENFIVLKNKDSLKSLEYHTALRHLRNYEFYLSDADCQKINQVKMTLEKVLNLNEYNSVLAENFHPNSLLNDDYFL